MPWVHQQIEHLKPQLKIAKNKPYSTADERADFDLLKSSFQLPLPNSATLPVAFNAVAASVSACSDHALNVEYDVFTTQFFSVPTAEAQQQTFNRPEQAANVTEPKIFQLLPIAGYNASDSFFAGGRLSIPVRSKAASLDSIAIDGAASNSYQSAAAALKGAFKPSAFGSLTWRLGYAYGSLPTNKQSFNESGFNGRLLATTRPLAGVGPVFRFGGQLEGGHLESRFQPGDLGPGAIASTPYSSARIYGGLTYGTKHTALRTSYGFEVGANGGLGDDWKRHVGDTSFNFWFPLSDHRPLQIESRFTAGAIQQNTGVAVPVEKKFFGGNTQESFLDDDDWDFRANPVLRSIPARQFNQTSSGIGADRFYALNLTVAPAIWRTPLLPSELTTDPDFKKKLDQQWGLSSALLAASYIAKDPAYLAVQGKLTAVANALASLAAALNSVKPTVTATQQQLYESCNVNVRLAGRRVTSARDATRSPDVTFGYIAELLREGTPQVLPKTLEACRNQLSHALNDSALTAAADQLNRIFEDLELAYARVDRAAAVRKGDKDLAFPRGILDTILHDVNIYSLSPILIFDTARIWPQTIPGNGLRYGVGGGIRLTLVSHANLTLGYARNLNRIPQESSGALFFAISITELLR